jgi:hypothetical protein
VPGDRTGDSWRRAQGQSQVEQRFWALLRSRSERAKIVNKSAPTYRFAHVGVVGRITK